MFFEKAKETSDNIRSNFLFTTLITDAVQCGIFSATSKMNVRYPRFVKKIIAIQKHNFTFWAYWTL